MTEDDSDSSHQEDFQLIPEEVQDISLDELLDSDYETDISGQGSERGKTESNRRTPVAHTPPGRTWNDGSIEASQEDLGGDSDGHTYSAGYESNMATRIGDETTDNDPETERLRELHEGRHRSDGSHSVRESQRDKKRLAQAICSSLPLTDRESREVVNVVEQIDFSRFGQQKGIPRVTLGTAAVLVDENRRQPIDDDNNIVAWSDEFRDICRRHDIEMSDLSTVKERVRDALSDGDVVFSMHPQNRDPNLPSPTDPSDQPRQYWDEKQPSFWIYIAAKWDHIPEDLKSGIPDDYREMVDVLRDSEDWERSNEHVPGAEMVSQTEELIDSIVDQSTD